MSGEQSPKAGPVNALSQPLGLRQFFGVVWSGDTARAISLLETHPNFASARTDQLLDDPVFSGRTYYAGSPEHSVAALHFACEHNQVELAKALIERGADVNAPGYHPTMGACSPLQIAARGGEERNRLISLLLAAGADPDVAMEQEEDETASEGDSDALEVLDLESAPHQGPIFFDDSEVSYTAEEFHDAVAKNQINLVKVILDIDPLMVNSTEPYHGFTALSSAPTGEMARLLLARGIEPGIVESAQLGLADRVRAWLEIDPALVHSRDLTRRTALHVAASHGHVETVELLLAHGADVNAQWVPGWTPMHMASMRSHHEVMTLLRRAGARG